MNELRDKVDRAIAGPVLYGFDGWRLDKPVIWEQIPEPDRKLLGSIADAAKIAAYAPEVLTPEVVEAAAMAMWAEQSDEFNQWYTLDVGERQSLTALAKAALLAAMATLRGDVR
jgi:hypothetical protein